MEYLLRSANISWAKALRFALFIFKSNSPGESF